MYIVLALQKTINYMHLQNHIVITGPHNVNFTLDILNKLFCSIEVWDEHL